MNQLDDLGTFQKSFSFQLFRDLNHSPERIWRALTDDREISVWMGHTVRLEPIVGTSVHIDFSPEEPLHGVVTHVRPNSLFAYSWGNSVLTWALAEQQRCIRLEFCHHHIEPKFAIGLAAGWHCFIDNLEAHLDGEIFADRFEELSELYSRKLNP